MPAKKKAQTLEQLTAALKEGGYTPTRRFKRLPGNAVEIFLKPAALKGEDGAFRADDICAVAGLQSTCRVFPAVPQDVLILRVQLPPAAQGKRQSPCAKPSANDTKGDA